MACSIVSYIITFGRLRVLLFTLALLAALFAPEPQARTVIEWPQIVPTLIAPSVAPLVLMVLLLDLLMTKVMTADEQDTGKKQRARRIMMVNVLVAAVLVFAYMPFFLALGR